MRTLACFSIVLALALAAPADAQQMRAWSAELPVLILPGEIPSPIYWNGIPDQGFDADWEWQALVCQEQCEIEPTRLQMTGVQVQPHDGEAMPGHKYVLERKFEVQPLVLFRGLPGAIPPRPETYLHAGLGRYPPARTQGTMEIDIPVPGEPARIVPRLLERKDNSPLINVYLEAGTRRQLLGGMAADSIMGPTSLARGTQLLRWAGDLDGDDKLDVIVSITSRAGEESTATLFLSSVAKPGELVGMAGHFTYWPVENPGC